MMVVDGISETDVQVAVAVLHVAFPVPHMLSKSPRA